MAGLSILSTAPSRAVAARGVRLAWITILWNVGEAAIALLAGGAAGSAALLAFGLDSTVESASGAFALRRLMAEARGGNPAALEQAERRAARGISLSLVALAVWILGQSLWTLVRAERPEATWIGIGLPLVSIAVMAWLARAKREVAGILGSRALESDAFQTTTCFRLSMLTLVGIGANAVAGLWWADPLAAVIMIVPVLQEARAAWKGRPCGCAPC